jgi:hypothetical protein
MGGHNNIGLLCLTSTKEYLSASAVGGHSVSSTSAQTVHWPQAIDENNSTKYANTENNFYSICLSASLGTKKQSAD